MALQTAMVPQLEDPVMTAINKQGTPTIQEVPTGVTEHDGPEIPEVPDTVGEYEQDQGKPYSGYETLVSWSQPSLETTMGSSKPMEVLPSVHQALFH